MQGAKILPSDDVHLESCLSSVGNGESPVKTQIKMYMYENTHNFFDLKFKELDKIVGDGEKDYDSNEPFFR